MVFLRLNDEILEKKIGIESIRIRHNIMAAIEELLPDGQCECLVSSVSTCY